MGSEQHCNGLHNGLYTYTTELHKQLYNVCSVVSVNVVT